MKKPRRRRGMSLRVQVWLYDVIGPIVDETLPNEQRLLREHNWTWDYRTGECRYIRPIREYLSPKTWPNYDDFCEEFDAFATFSPHDGQLRGLNEEARSLLEVLIESEDFLKKVKAFMEEWQGIYPGGAILREEFHKLMAQHVVNNIGELPSHYTDSSFWQRFGRELKSLAKVEYVQRVSAHGEELERINEVVMKRMREIRKWLCDEYGLPPARPTWALPGEF